MMDPAHEQRRYKRKKHAKKYITDQLALARLIKQHNVQGLIIDTAVWICAEPFVINSMDEACFGHLDGGAGTARFVKEKLAAIDVTVTGHHTIRLALDEAFYMSYALNNLTVFDLVPNNNNDDTITTISTSSAKQLDHTELWQRCRSLRSDFLPMYLAYHHYRSKGWIARTGQQYGADYVLYQRHPAIAHSDYSIMIIPLPSSPPSQQQSEESPMRPSLDWHDVQVLNRMSTQVCKRLILFYVKDLSGGGSGDTYDSPKCLSQWAVHERMIKRWVPEAHRE